jgi:polyisoprenoid-binding protein YceI
MATTWNFDRSHSELGFKVKHLMISNVSGTFENFDVQAVTEGDDFSTAKINFSADTASINTSNEQRDGHLKSGDFFESEVHPKMTFASSKMEKIDDHNFVLHGDLSIRGVAKPVKLNVEFGGIGQDPWGNTKAGFSVSGKINRSDWNLTWNAPLEAGGVLLSDEIRINADIQLSK